MSEKPKRRKSPKAYRNRSFLDSTDARVLRMMSEYLEPRARFARHKVEDTVVFMGSARTPSREAAEAALAHARAGGGDVAAAERALASSAYYEAARELAHRLTVWSKGLGQGARRFVVCTGAGPGIMEAANRGAAEARGINVGLRISIPIEEHNNEYVTRDLDFDFHYFFMRKFWFVYLAKAVVVFPGGFGTLDELFELLTLVQTRKLSKRLPIVLFGGGFWDEVVDFEALVRHGTISPGDPALMHRTDSIDEAFEIVTAELTAFAMGTPGGRL
jgi:hypothetical protein